MSDQCSTSSGSTKEVGEIVGKGVELEAHRVADVLRLQQLLGLSQRRIGAEMEIDAPLGVAANHRWDKIVRAFTDAGIEFIPKGGASLVSAQACD